MARLPKGGMVGGGEEGRGVGQNTGTKRFLPDSELFGVVSEDD